MARKHLLDGLMQPAPPADPADPATPPPEAGPRVDIARPRYGGGAIGAVSQSIAALKSRSVSDLDVELIDPGGLIDRIDLTDPDHASLVASIRDHGQQIPILVRPHADMPGRFQIVYGRRRLAALRELGLPARALVRDLDDRAAVMAQGQENSARKDLTFIERVNFARQMRTANYDRKAICDALNVDKTVISRMMAIADTVPIDVIELVGSAPGIGRDRWADLATRFENGETDVHTAATLVALLPEDADSDARFEAVLRSAVPRPKPPRTAQLKQVQKVRSDNGILIARVTRKPTTVLVTLPREGNGGFEEWLAQRLPEIHRDWMKKSSGGD